MVLIVHNLTIRCGHQPQLAALTLIIVGLSRKYVLIKYFLY